MLNNVLKIAFAFIGIVTGFTVSTISFSWLGIEQQFILTILISFVTGVTFFIISSKSIKYLTEALDKFEKAIHNMSIYEIGISVVGLIAGLIIANLITIPVVRIEIIGVPIAVIANILFATLGVFIASSKRGETATIFQTSHMDKSNKSSTDLPKLLDTSTIIDGRIIDVCNAGFVEGKVIIPSFVLEELRHIADSADNNKRARGRRGLDVIDILQKDKKLNVEIINMDDISGEEVDDKLLKAALKMRARIITNDFNLNKVAKIQGVDVLNINDLANAVKPLAIPGEEMTIQVVKDGKENGQGIGYLNDGTMIVVENGKGHMGEVLEVIVTSVLQTSAGRMIFAKPKHCLVER